MCSHNCDFPQWMGLLSYLVNTMATDELAMPGARASATMELVRLSRIIPIPATLFFPMCMQVQFSIHTFCTETDIRFLLNLWLSYILTIWYQYYYHQIMRYIWRYILSTINTCSNLRSCPSEWLKYSILNLLCFMYDLYDYKVWNTARW